MILTLMVALVLCRPALAQSGDPPGRAPVVLTDEQDEYPLGLLMDILEDPSGELTIKEVASPAFDARFTPSQETAPNYGFTDSVYWVRLRLDNETRFTNQWLLEVGYANMHYVDLYTPLPGGDGYSVKQTGAFRPPASRDIRHPRIVFNLIAPTQGQQTFYLRFQNGSSMTLPLTLWTPTAFLNASQLEQVLHGFLFGALFILLAYNLLLLFSFRDKIYLYMVALLSSLIVFELSYIGYMEILVIPQLYHLKLYYHAPSFALIFVSLVLFTDGFLEIKIQLPRLHWVNMAIVAGWGVLLLLIPFTNYHRIANLMVPWALPSLFAVLAAGIASWRTGFRPARLFMIASFGLAVALIITILVRLGVIPSSGFRENVIHLGFAWMAAWWSVALADHINLLKAETENANRALHRSEHKLSQILDGLPLGVTVYGKDQKPTYVNRRTVEILSSPASGIQVDPSAGRTLAQATDYFSLHLAGSDQEYPLENVPVYRALRGEPASVDDIEAHLGDRRVPLEIWASPVRDDGGNVESAVAAFQDITARKENEAELEGYRHQLEHLVSQRTAQLGAVNEQLQTEIGERKHLEAMLRMRLDWLAAVNLVNQTMARSTDFAQIYEKILEIINHLFESQDSFIAELDKGGNNLTILAHSCGGESHPDLVGSRTLLPDRVRSDPNIELGKLAYFSKDVLSELSGPMGRHLEVSEIHIIVLVPLQLRERAFGFVGLEIDDEERTISSDEMTLLEIFSFDIARLIEDARLFEQTKALITAEERNRLARDLHDSVTQMLFSASLVAEVLPQIWRRDPERALQSLDNVRRLTRGALAEMRTMLLELRPSAVINTPLGELLAQLTEAVTSRSGLPARLFIEQTPSLPEEVHTSFYRIAQEALNNVVKHAQAKRVTVSLSATPVLELTDESRHEVKLVIEDDGVGYASGMRSPGHLGMGIMRERAAAIHATLTLESQPGYGTQVTLIWCNESEDPS